jgi:hypothetical protein
MMTESEREELRILRAVAERRLRVNECGRYVIDGEARPKRQVRERLMSRGLISLRDLTMNGGGLTKKGWERYEELLAQEAASEEGR